MRPDPFGHDSMEAVCGPPRARRSGQGTASSENPEVHTLFLTLREVVSAFNEQVAPFPHLEDRDHRSAENKAWMADPIAQENGHHQQA